MGDAKPTGLKLDADALRPKIKEVVRSMTAKNWAKKKAELFESKPSVAPLSDRIVQFWALRLLWMLTNWLIR